MVLVRYAPDLKFEPQCSPVEPGVRSVGIAGGRESSRSRDCYRFPSCRRGVRLRWNCPPAVLISKIETSASYRAYISALDLLTSKMNGGNANV